MKSLLCALTMMMVASPVVAMAQDPSPIVIGASLPLTGTVSTFGQHSRWGSELAIQEANAAGGILGRKVEMDYQDNRCNPAEAVKSVTQMIAEKKYVAIFDGLCSSAALAIMPLVERAEIPFVVANASATSIAEKSGVGGNEWTFKVNPTDASMLDALVGWLQKEGKASNIAFIGEDTDFGRAGSEGLEAALKKKNLKLSSIDFYQKGTADFTTLLAKVRSKKPQEIALYSIDADFQNLIRQWAGMGAGIPLTGRVLLDQVPAQILASGMLNGSTAVQPYSESVDLPANKAFVAAYKKMTGQDPILVGFESYEATKILLDAIKRAGSTDHTAVRDALKKTSYPSILGVDLKFDDHNLVHNNAVILGVKDGKVVVLGFSKT